MSLSPLVEIKPLQENNVLWALPLPDFSWQWEENLLPNPTYMFSSATWFLVLFYNFSSLTAGSFTRVVGLVLIFPNPEWFVQFPSLGTLYFVMFLHSSKCSKREHPRFCASGGSAGESPRKEQGVKFVGGMDVERFGKPAGKSNPSLPKVARQERVSRFGNSQRNSGGANVPFCEWKVPLPWEFSFVHVFECERRNESSSKNVQGWKS